MKIELNGIHKRFGAVHANDDITLTFESGRIVGILGENGAGKSTLMKILSGYQKADAGTIMLDGRRADYTTPQQAIAHGIGMLQQDPLDVAAFSVLENFVYGNPRLSRHAARAELNRLAARFGFALDPDALTAQLSIAQRQQLEIVRLLALGVRLLILDEPTTGISGAQKGLLFEALRELAVEGITILLVSHKLEDVIALCDEVAVLRAGRVVGRLTMPTSTEQIVTLMFGEAVPVVQRERRDLTAQPVALTLENVTLAQGRINVDGFTLRLRAGEIVGLAGLEGSGQELVLRACAGLIKPARGRVLVREQDVTGLPFRALMQRGVAFAAAGRIEEGLVAGLTLTEHVALTTERGVWIDWHKAARHTQTMIERYQVRGTPERQIETLSGGNQQRVLMGLMPEQPTALVLEQPTRGLDVDSARWIWEQLLARRAAGAAILFSSAELDEILAYSDRVIVFYAGRATEVSEPAHTSVEALGTLIGGGAPHEEQRV
jgi:general nucleoside transport system ATP-binding protein